MLQNTQVLPDQQPLPQQLHATAEQPHVPPPVTPYHLPTQQHTHVSGHGHEFGSQPVYPLGFQQQEVTPQGNLWEIVIIRSIICVVVYPDSVYLLFSLCIHNTVWYAIICTHNMRNDQ